MTRCLTLHRDGGETTVKSLLPDLMREGREAKGKMSQTKLGELIGKDQPYISKLERGETQIPELAVLEDIGRALDIEYDDLLLAIGGRRRVKADPHERPVKFLGRVPADHVRWCEVEGKKETVDVWASMFQAYDPDRCFVVAASGDCLIKKGIVDGDLVLLREPEPNERPRDNTIVLVRISDEFSLKVWKRNGRWIQLVDGDENIVFETDVDHAGDITVLGIHLNDYKDPRKGVR